MMWVIYGDGPEIPFMKSLSKSPVWLRLKTYFVKKLKICWSWDELYDYFLTGNEFDLFMKNEFADGVKRHFTQSYPLPTLNIEKRFGRISYNE